MSALKSFSYRPIRPFSVIPFEGKPERSVHPIGGNRFPSIASRNVVPPQRDSVGWRRRSRTDRFEYPFANDCGQFTEIVAAGTSVMTDRPQFDSFRAPVQNEGRVQSAMEWAAKPRPTTRLPTDARAADGDPFPVAVETSVGTAAGAELFRVSSANDVYGSVTSSSSTFSRPNSSPLNSSRGPAPRSRFAISTAVVPAGSTPSRARRSRSEDDSIRLHSGGRDLGVSQQR